MSRHTIDVILLALVVLIIGYLSIAPAQHLQALCSKTNASLGKLCETYNKTLPSGSSYTWFNFRTQKHDLIIGLPDNLEDYIPRIPPAINMYRVYIDMGKTPLEAYELTMKAVVESQ